MFLVRGSPVTISYGFKSNLTLKNNPREFLPGQITRRINVLDESRLKWTWHHSKLAVEEVNFFRRSKVVLLQLYINTWWSSQHDGLGCHAPMLTRVRNRHNYWMTCIEFTCWFSGCTKIFVAAQYFIIIKYPFIWLSKSPVQQNSLDTWEVSTYLCSDWGNPFRSLVWITSTGAITLMFKVYSSCIRGVHVHTKEECNCGFMNTRRHWLFG